MEKFQILAPQETLTIWLHTVPCTLNTQDNKVQLTRAFADVCQLHQLRHSGDVVWDAVVF